MGIIKEERYGKHSPPLADRRLRSADRSAFASLIQQAKAARGEAPDLTAIVVVLSKAAALIQSKG